MKSAFAPQTFDLTMKRSIQMRSTLGQVIPIHFNMGDNQFLRFLSAISLTAAWVLLYQNCAQPQTGNSLGLSSQSNIVCQPANDCIPFSIVSGPYDAQAASTQSRLYTVMADPSQSTGVLDTLWSTNCVARSSNSATCQWTSTVNGASARLEESTGKKRVTIITFGISPTINYP